MTNVQQLDASGLNCPLPILRTKKALKMMSEGESLEVISTDPGSVKDLEAFCSQTGNELLSAKQQNDRYVFLIRKV